jgi:serine/threonine-protein phosphatase 2A activator
MATAAQNPSPSLPTKRIVSKAHLDAWLSSSTHSDVVQFISDLNESIVGIKLGDTVAESDVSPTSRALLCPSSGLTCRVDCSSIHLSHSQQATKALVEVLEGVEAVAKDTPPVDNGKSRFGNPAFRDFYDKVASVRFHLFCLFCFRCC